MQQDKPTLRRELRARRRTFVAALDPATRALLFLRPPAPIARLMEAMPGDAAIGLYAARRDEAPTLAYARWFAERGRQVALPWFADQDAPMRFRLWTDPWAPDSLETGPFGDQPAADAREAIPPLLFMPLVGFTADGKRLGQGGGHYDRWLEAHRATAIGLGWDCQQVEALPVEPHDAPLAAIVTPTRLYECARP